jgi:hypothetical protein
MINLIKYLKNYLFIATCIFIFSSNVVKADEKDMVIVLDTSLSMVGKGGKNIMSQVKERLNSFIDRLDDGDSITFATFDTKVNIYHKVEIDDDNDRKILKNYISMVEAHGKWTHTYKMVDSLKEYVESLEADSPDRERLVVVLTDALDDPPPANRKNRLNIEKIADKTKSLEAYIYWVSLGKHITLKEKQAKFKHINAGDDVNTAMDEVQSDIDAKNATFLSNPYFIAIIIVLLLLLLLWLLQRISRLKVFGMLEYYDHSMFHKDITTIDLTRLNLRRVTMGRNPQDNIKPRDYKENKSVVLKAVGFGGAVQVQVDEKEGTEVEFIKNKKESFLEDGDTFKVGTYTCTYLSSK